METSEPNMNKKYLIIIIIIKRIYISLNSDIVSVTNATYSKNEEQTVLAMLIDFVRNVLQFPKKEEEIMDTVLEMDVQMTSRKKNKNKS